MKYRVLFPSEAIQNNFHKVLNKIGPQNLQDEIMNEIEELGDHPRPEGEPKLKPPIIVYQYAAQYRLKIGHWRVLYDVDDARKIVWIFALRKRNERTYS